METNPDVEILTPLVAQIEKRISQNKNKNRVEDDILGYIEQKHIDAYERLFLNPKYDSLTDILSPYIYMEQDRKNREIYNSAMRLGDSMLKQANQNLRSKFANVKRSTTHKNILKVVTNMEAEHNASMREHDAMMRQHNANMAKMGGRRKTRQYAGASKQEVAQKMLEYQAAYAELKHARELRAAAPQKFRMVDPQTGLPKYTLEQQETIRQGIKGKIEAAEEKFYRLEAELKAMTAELSAAQAPVAVVTAPEKSWIQRMFGRGRRTHKKRGGRKHRGTRKH
jgi:hypothetical protein